MKRMIPPSTKSKTISFWGLSSLDVIVGAACVGFMAYSLLKKGISIFRIN